MKRIPTGFLMTICVLMALLLAGPAVAAKKVIVISGVSEQSAKAVGNYLEVNDGIKEVLAGGNIVPEFWYEEIEKLADENAKAAKGKEVADKIKAAKPDLVITVNDNTLKHVGLNIEEIPVVFTFLWGSPQSVGLPKANITGVARRSYAVDVFKMAKQLTGGQTVALLSKNSLSMAGVKQMFTAKAADMEKASGVKYMDMFLCDTFEEWSQQVQNFKYDFIYLADSSRIMKGDKELTREETVQWTVANAKVPVVAGSSIDVKNGALFAIDSSSKEWGRQSGTMALKILNGTPIAQLPMEQMQKGSLFVNAKTAQKMKINIPYEILSSAEKVFE